MKYWVRLKIEGRIEVEVEANSPEEAKIAGENEIYDLDFGNLEEIEWEAVNCEDENNSHTDY